MKIIKFTSKTCGPCRLMNEVFDHLKLYVDDEKIFEEVDVTLNEEVVSKYSVRQVPTIVFCDDEKEERIVGIKSLNDLKKIYENFIKNRI